MLSMAPVGSAGGAAKYFAADNYYTLEESAEESLWYGEGAELLGLAPSDGDASEDIRGKDDEDTEKPEKRAGDGLEDEDPEVDAPAVEGDGAEAGAGEPQGDAEGQQEPVSALSDPETTESSPGPADGSDDAALAAHSEDGATIDAPFDPEVPTGEAAAPVASTQPVSTPSSTDDATPFDPDRAGGLPEGVSASATTSAESTHAGKMPLSNPSGKVDATTFENILNGVLPDGTQVGKPGDRQLGIDLTFSMPKSASLLAFVGGDKRILEADMGAVKTAMRWVEANLAETRVRDNQGQYPVRTGNLVYALFQHDTSRALDPQGHVHAVIANMTRLPNGQWQSLHNGAIWRNNTVTSSIYHAAFRDALEKIGYTVELQGKHGTFEIAGVPKAIREAFSQRRETILEKAAELGTLTPKGMDRITTNSRDAKVNVRDREALRAEWIAKADELGWKPDGLINEARQREVHQPGLFERGLTAIEGAMREARTFVTDQLRGAHDPLVDTGLDRLKLSPDQARTQLAVASAIRILSQREAAFEINQITKTALDLGLRHVKPGGIATRVTELIKSDQLVPGVSDRRDNLVTMVTTREAIDTEIAIIGEIDKGKGMSAPALAHDRAVERITAAAGEQPLNDGQMGAAVAILTSSDRIIAVQGDAGTGKSTMLRPVADILKVEGHKVIGLAFQTKVASALREDTGIEAMTVARFLIDYRGVLEGDKAATKQSRATLSGSYLFLDETSMISNNQMLALTQIANVTGANLSEIGDRNQLLPIDSGKSFALSQAAGIATSRMTENLRQKTPELRAAAELSKLGKTGDAIRTLGDIVNQGPERNKEAAQWWLALSLSERSTAAIFTSGKESRAEINARVQEGLRVEGTLTGNELTVRVNEPVDRTREEMRYAKSYEPGMTLEVWKAVASAGLHKGEYRVARVFGNGKVELERGGKRISFKPEKLPSSIKDDRLKLAVTKEVRIQEGERIRWTTNDRNRDLLNGTLSKVLQIDGGRVTVERPDQSVLVLERGDPMLKRLDLAYALNMHMAQGMTADKGALVMGSEERFLANQRLAHVGLTRVREDLRIFTDDKEKLIRQIDRTSGNKTSALEVTGQLQVDKDLTTATIAKDRERPFEPGPIADLSQKSESVQSKRLDALYPGLAPAEKAPGRSVPQLSVPEKTKGMDI